MSTENVVDVEVAQGPESVDVDVAQAAELTGLESQLPAADEDRDRTERELAESATKLQAMLGARMLEQSRTAKLEGSCAAWRRHWYVPWTWRHGAAGRN